MADPLDVECQDRAGRGTQRLVRAARFLRPERLEDFDANPSVTPEIIGSLQGSAWGRPLVLIGDSGTGTSHLLIGAGTATTEAGHGVRYTTTAALVNELAEAAAGRHLSSTTARHTRVDLLCLDEFGR
ncbi:ATP-binding protein [Streptomyces sp. NPDC093223]|uniref:ATP-binding protein n=1 Tax=Streptomyces sp. NPDC093223 TaxID=3366033 RepID=UPI00382B2689